MIDLSDALRKRQIELRQIPDAKGGDIAIHCRFDPGTQRSSLSAGKIFGIMANIRSRRVRGISLMENALLDTCALIYYIKGEERFRKALAYKLHVSPINFWEIELLLKMGRISFSRPLKEVMAAILSSAEELMSSEAGPILQVKVLWQ